jgi:hypothetical protein
MRASADRPARSWRPALCCLFEDCGGRSLPRSVLENSPGSGLIGAAHGLIVTDPQVIQREHQLPWRLEWSAAGAGARR